MRGRWLLGGQHRCRKQFGVTRPASSVISSSLTRVEFETYALVLYGGAVSSQDEFLCCIGEVDKTSDWQIFMIELRVLAKYFLGLKEL